MQGNHDITLDSSFYEQFGLYFHNQNPQDTEQCQGLFEQSKSITYLKHNAAVVKLTSPDGPRTTFKIFGSPYSPAKGQWAFGYQPEEATKLWDEVPLDVDITVTHTPPKYHCDEANERRAAGCEALRCMLWRVRPRLAICGHVHEGRGAEIVEWDLGVANIKYKELGVDRWTEADKKKSLLDLTSNVDGRRMLANDGSVGGNLLAEEQPGPEEPGSVRNRHAITFQESDSVENPIPSVLQKDSPRHTIQQGLSQVANSLLAVPKPFLVLTTKGQGGIPPSNRCDLEALSGRLGRKETCVINAAIAANSYPHQGGKKFNKPIVVDIDLPCWDEDSSEDE